MTPPQAAKHLEAFPHEDSSELAPAAFPSRELGVPHSEAPQTIYEDAETLELSEPEEQEDTPSIPPYRMGSRTLELISDKVLVSHSQPPNIPSILARRMHEGKYKAGDPHIDNEEVRAERRWMIAVGKLATPNPLIRKRKDFILADEEDISSGNYKEVDNPAYLRLKEKIEGSMTKFFNLSNTFCQLRGLKKNEKKGKVPDFEVSIKTLIDLKRDVRWLEREIRAMRYRGEKRKNSSSAFRDPLSGTFSEPKLSRGSPRCRDWDPQTGRCPHDDDEEEVEGIDDKKEVDDATKFDDEEGQVDDKTEVDKAERQAEKESEEEAGIEPPLWHQILRQNREREAIDLTQEDEEVPGTPLPSSFVDPRLLDTSSLGHPIISDFFGHEVGGDQEGDLEMADQPCTPSVFMGFTSSTVTKTGQPRVRTVSQPALNS